MRNCRAQCYPTISPDALDRRYIQYGGIARYVLRLVGEPPSIEAVVRDYNARDSIRAVGDPSQIFPSSHMLLHLSVDENLQFQHVVLASRYVGGLLFEKFFDETYERLTSLLGGGGTLAGHLSECYVHFLFKGTHERKLICESLEGNHSL